MDSAKKKHFSVEGLLGSCCCSVTSVVSLCDPMDCSPLGSSVHGDSLGKNTGEPCPPPGHLPNPGTESLCLTSPAVAGRFFYH